MAWCEVVLMGLMDGYAEIARVHGHHILSSGVRYLLHARLVYHRPTNVETVG